MRNLRYNLGIREGWEWEKINTLRRESERDYNPQRDELRIAVLKERIAQALLGVRKYVKPGVSLVDELLAERRAEATRE